MTDRRTRSPSLGFPAKRLPQKVQRLRRAAGIETPRNGCGNSRNLGDPMFYRYQIDYAGCKFKFVAAIPHDQLLGLESGRVAFSFDSQASWSLIVLMMVSTNRTRVSGINFSRRPSRLGDPSAQPGEGGAAIVILRKLPSGRSKHTGI